MARRSAFTNGINHNIGDAPPASTIAAQIVQTQIRSVAPQHGGILRTLLHDFLHNEDAVQETDVNINAQLIEVVIVAGLSSLTTENPFINWEDSYAQARDSIRIIQQTIAQQPDVLLVSVNNGPPALLGLLATLLSLCGRAKLQSLHIIDLINSIIRALQSSINLWQYAHHLRDVLQNCVDDILSALETSPKGAPTLDLRLPPVRAVRKLWPNSEGSIAIPQGSTATLNEPALAFILSTQLCEVVGLDTAWRQHVYMRLQRLLSRLKPQLEKAKQWDIAVEALLHSPVNCSVLAFLLRDSTKSKPALPMQANIASSICTAIKKDGRLAQETLLPSCRLLGESETFNALDEKLKIAITACLCYSQPDRKLPKQVISTRDAILQGDAMLDDELSTVFHELTTAVTVSPKATFKKRRLARGETDSSQLARICRLIKILTGAESQDLSAISETAVIQYGKLTEEEQCTVWQCLISLAASHPSSTIRVVSNLLNCSDLQRTKKARVLSMRTIGACVQGSEDPAVVSLATSKFGQTCLQSLHSSLRELRIAAGQVLPCFLRSSLPESIQKQNRHLALEYLRSVSDRDIASEQETLVATWSRVGLACGLTELNLVLLRLVQYLGHSNSFICALASSEIERVAGERSVSVGELFRPFWRSIAISVVQDLRSKPQKMMKVCELLGMDSSDFLRFSQRDVLPTLVLSKNHSVLRKIAEACGSGCTIGQMCLKPIANLAGIITMLLNHFGPDGESSAFSCLLEVDADFQKTDLADLVKIDAVAIACEMLRYCGDQDESRKPRSHQAFQVLVSLVERSPGQRKANSKASSRVIASFFEKHILGILAHYSTMLVDGSAAQLIHEKARCLRGMEEMFKLAKGQVSIALPQIRACLQSGLNQPELCETSFCAWLSLIPVLDGDEIAQIIDETFALILKHWAELTADTQKRTHDAVADIVKTHNKTLQERISNLPSLSGIPLLSKFAAEFERLRSHENAEVRCKSFVQRLQVDSDTVVLQALNELVPFLEKNQDYVHEAAATENPASVISELIRAQLDVTVKYAHVNQKAADLCGRALGIIGCLDPNRVETIRKKRQVLILSNFNKEDEVVEWVMALLEDVLVKAFKSVTNTRAQGFLAYAIQELLKSCKFADSAVLRSRSSQVPGTHHSWNEMPEHVRTTLTPFLTSRYVVTSMNGAMSSNRVYPGFSLNMNHNQWLRAWTTELLLRAKGENANMVFPLFRRVIPIHDISIARSILPYIVLNVVIGGTASDGKDVSDEMLAVLSSKPTTSTQQETSRLCSENVFVVLDHMNNWLRGKSKVLAEARNVAYRTGHTASDFDEEADMGQIETLENFLASIPAAVIAKQAIECRSYARALFHWEQYMRQERSLKKAQPSAELSDELYERLVDIYAQIDEPDGLEGISARLPIITEQQQATNHAKAGRWAAAQAWYELQLNTSPDDTQLQHDLLNCLRETGRYDPLLKYADSFLASAARESDQRSNVMPHLPSALEACWMTEDLKGLEQRLRLQPRNTATSFSVGISKIIMCATKQDEQAFTEEISLMRRAITEGLSAAGTDSLQACHDEMKKLHVLYEMESLMFVPKNEISKIQDTFEKRLTAVGSYVQDKQYILGLRRTMMRIRSDAFRNTQTGALWMSTAKLARQAQNIGRAHNAVLKAVQCGCREAKLEEARLLWHEGHQRQAIQSLESVIESGLFELDPGADVPMHDTISDAATSTTTSHVTSADKSNGHSQNKLSAKAYLLLAKWLDASGQSQTKDMTERYQLAARRFQRWEKGHYYLAKHYSKLLDAQKALPKEKRSQAFLTGEMAKLVVENSLRSIPFGNKYWHETIPRLLTLWLELGSDVEKKTPREDPNIVAKRINSLQACNKQLQKYFERVPCYVFYHALPQLISRITHPHADIWKQLCNILTRIVSTHPSQSLWSIFAVVKARDGLRKARGEEVINRVKDPKNRIKPDSQGLDLRTMITQGQKLAEGLLCACEAPVDARATSANLFADLGFSSKLAPSNLVVPIETTLTASSMIQATSDDIRKHKAFTQDRITIQSFSEHVQVLSSLQRPRKIIVRGSDGKEYGLLCKPKDDLRKDQRLMEFNGIINRALKRNTESSKRRLYIKTYAVTPLSEESGTIEWVEGIKPMRDILLSIYQRKGNRPNYNDIRKDLDAACKAPEHAHLFAEKVLVKFPASLHEWFSGTYSQPEMWFAARLRYARSAAVMSMTGYILGLGDRHGENILLEESTGGVFHVDFNCLFDKGLTFDKPELVPFRLTHNMVDAMGPYGYDGPFRKCCELTLSLLRQERDTLMTVLETFLYDPTTDFVGKKKRSTAGVPETPAEILESVATKLRGLLRGETVPLSVDGHVDALIQEATDAFRLASMYIGWCSFL